MSCVTKPLLFGEASKFVCSICNFGEEHLSKESYTDEQAMHLAVSPIFSATLTLVQHCDMLTSSLHSVQDK